MVWIILLLLSVVSACLYRMGGCGPADLLAEWGWVPAPIRNFPKKRDLGCGVMVILGCLALGLPVPWWAYLISVGIMWGALSTYHDTMFYNWMKPNDNFWLHGFFIGLAMFPIAFFTDPLALGIRCFVLAILMGAWSFAMGNAKWEEMGRGFVMPITLGLLLLI